MSKTKFLISLALAISILAGQVGGVLAAPALQKSATITGTVQSITLEIDPTTAVTTVIVEVKCADQSLQTVRISQNTAVTVGLVILDGDGKPAINNQALGKSVAIDPATVIPDQAQDRNPVANALSTFFSDVPGMDYETIMAAREQGISFRAIAQALWLTKQLKGNDTVFEDLLVARQTGDYTAFTLADGTVPKNWGQLQKAILDGKKLGKADDSRVPNQNNNGNNKDKNKDKEKNKDNGNSKDKKKNK